MLLFVKSMLLKWQTLKNDEVQLLKQIPNLSQEIQFSLFLNDSEALLCFAKSEISAVLNLYIWSQEKSIFMHECSN